MWEGFCTHGIDFIDPHKVGLFFSNGWTGPRYNPKDISSGFILRDPSTLVNNWVRLGHLLDVWFYLIEFCCSSPVPTAPVQHDRLDLDVVPPLKFASRIPFINGLQTTMESRTKQIDFQCSGKFKGRLTVDLRDRWCVDLSTILRPGVTYSMWKLCLRDPGTRPSLRPFGENPEVGREGSGTTHRDVGPT